MRSPKWSDLLVDIERIYPACSKPNAKLTTEQVAELKAVENAGECFNITILHGVAAIGELLAHASNTGGLHSEVVNSAGWLVNSLAMLSMTITESADAASYKLQTLPQKAQIRDAKGGVQ
jgi:hypothetical protein